MKIKSKIKSKKTVYSLKPESVDAVSEDVQAFLAEMKVSRKNIISARLTIENILLDLIDEYGAETKFTFTKSNFFGNISLSVSVEGKPFNPLEKGGNDEFGNWSSALIQNAEYSPSYLYDRGVNTVTMRFTKKGINPAIKLGIGIISAFAVSTLRAFIPAGIISFIEVNVLDSLYKAFLGLMATIEFPLVFLSITCGIIGIGDSTVFGKIGRKLVLRFVMIVMLFTTFAGVIFALVFIKFADVSEGSLSLKAGIDMLLSIIPNSLIDPITSGNTMQVVLMAIIIGVTLVILGNKTKNISTIINEGNFIIVFIAKQICRLLPFFIFIVLLDMIWSDNIGIFINMWKPVAAFVAVLLLLYFATLIKVSIKEKVSILLLMKKMMPTFLIGFGTASSVAANGECSESLVKTMGVNQRFVEFGQPTGGVVFMPSTAINFMVCAVYMAVYYNVDVSVLWFVFAICICSFVAIATPPVPGGAIAAYSLIFTQLGIPSDAVAIVVALDIVFDFIATAFDGSFLQLELIQQAEENKMLNYDILRKNID